MALTKTLYQSGLPFGEAIVSDLNAVIKRVFVENKVAMIIIDGGLGMGKTTLGVHLADYFNGAYVLDGPFYKTLPEKLIDFDKQLMTGGDTFKKKMRSLTGKTEERVIIYDEAGDFSRRGALTTFNRELNHMFDVYRAFKLILILILPSFKYLDISLLDKQIPVALFHIGKRNQHYGDYAIYPLVKMYYLLNQMQKQIVPLFAYKTQTPFKQGHFVDLTPERSKLLDEFSLKGKRELMHSYEIQDKRLLSFIDLGARVNRSAVWVRQTIKKLNIKPVKVFKKVNYFPPEVADQLVKEIVI